MIVCVVCFHPSSRFLFDALAINRCSNWLPAQAGAFASRANVHRYKHEKDNEYYIRVARD
jgi:hypothetical protein